nr:PREDICTED: uncharacterized protein LOC109033695 [Bemisia tabaci]
MSTEKNEREVKKADAPEAVSVDVLHNSEVSLTASTSKSQPDSSMPHLSRQLETNKFNSIKKHFFGWKNKKRKGRGKLKVWDKNYNDDILLNLTKPGFWQTKNGPGTASDSEDCDENDTQGNDEVRQRLLNDSNNKLVEIVKHNNNIKYYDCDMPSSSTDSETREESQNPIKLTNGCELERNEGLGDNLKKDFLHCDKRRKTGPCSFKETEQDDYSVDKDSWQSELKTSRSFQNVCPFDFTNSGLNLKRNISVGDEMYSKDTIVCLDDKLRGIIQTKVFKRHSSDNLLNPNLVSILCNHSKSSSNPRRRSKVDFFLKSLLALTPGKKQVSGDGEVHKGSDTKTKIERRPVPSSPNSFSASFNELNAVTERSLPPQSLCKSCSDINYVISSTPYCKVHSDNFSNLKFIDSDCDSSILNNSLNSNLDNACSDCFSLKASSPQNLAHPTFSLETDDNLYQVLENSCSTESLSQNCTQGISCTACVENLGLDQCPAAPRKSLDCGKPSCKAQSVCSSEYRGKKASRYRPQSVILASSSLSPASHLSAVKSAQNLCNSRSELSLSSAHSHGSVLPIEPTNRLRVPSVVISGSKFLSTCSSLLSMASSSKYSISSSAAFIPVKGKNVVTVLCKVCLNEVELKDSWTLQQCNCTYCVSCVRAYVEFEINQGAYHISCPDAQCKSQGIIQMEEIESLVNFDEVEKHKRFKLNKEVELDKSRVWCPRPGCETVCTLASTVERTVPQCVHCVTCSLDFCSNCRAGWHPGTPCRQEDLQPSIPGVSFDSELIKCCPMCSVPIEKDEGCAQMMCKRCKHVFCWYCLASLDDDFLLRHYDKGPCKNKLGHSRASVIWHRTQVIGIFAGFGILLLIASPLLLLAAPCIICCKCRVCTSGSKLDGDDLPEDDLT